MHLPTTRTLPYQPSANPAGTPARLPRKHSRWLELEPLSLPLELAFWALWHCRHARPPGPACRLHAVPRRCRRRSAAASVATLPDKTDKRAP
ncbi:hypothetical protein AO930_32230 [Pseudomonas aeruginosa]|uniref:hypothetical protein n=1 Tax=Pseudomonas aeruginosa TaxID=287 RepID=UPI0008FAF4F1|nr:hypothetical protein [Pseudomonas aeruginosa]OPD83138.1 hypothetical protein AO930_32230 [Pseudomonas aeruginosa]